MAILMTTTGTLRCILMLAGDLVSGSVTGIFIVIGKIPIVTPSLFNQNHRITRHHISKSVIKTATTGRQPVVSVDTD